MKKTILFIHIIIILAMVLYCKPNGNRNGDTLNENSSTGAIYYLPDSSLGIEAVPSSLGSQYTRQFDRYTKVTAPNGKAIHIVAQTRVSNEQMVRARNVLEHYLTNYSSSQYGSNKNSVANKMTDNNAILLLLNGSDDGSNDPTVDGQALYQEELVVEGSSAYVNNDYENHRDATFEEILHLVHDYGIGVDGNNNTLPGALPAYQSEIRSAQENALNNNIWGIGEDEWIQELTEENSLTQEYLAAVIDSYYGLWGAYRGNNGMWGLYKPKTRSEIQSEDPKGWSLIGKYFHPYLTYNARIDSSFNGTFYMTYNSGRPYTHKSQYLRDITLTGSNNTKIKGNGYNNSITGNSGSNTVIFSGNYSGYTVTKNGSTVTVRDNSSNRDGTDTLTKIEYLQFADQTVDVNSIGGGGGGDAQIALSRSQMIFAGTTSGAATGSQSFQISNTGSGNLNWTVSTNRNWLSVFPSSGTNLGIVDVMVTPPGTVGSYSGSITITDSNASNSPQTLSVQLSVINNSAASPPFGEFATPINNSTVAGSIAVTGWVLDDIGVNGVEIWCIKDGNYTLIDHALFVEGARPDVESTFPNYPANYKSGWGYMMLTHFLPGGGNGTYGIQAIAEDQEGNHTSLGIKSININNNGSTKPFGAIDTPTQGGTASGTEFINWGWALTPQPNKIPENGSTIKVFIDSINLGNPIYNIYRGDIANFFPGYQNSNGASGYFVFDTTAYDNGIHTIQWTVTDNNGNTDGIGSRFFNIYNSSSSRTNSLPNQNANQRYTASNITFAEISNLPINNTEPVKIKKGFLNNAWEFPTHDFSGAYNIIIEELKPIEIKFSSSNNIICGYVTNNSKLSPLPIGSTLDKSNGTFHWYPIPGFLGQYQLTFIEEASTGIRQYKPFTIEIIPKTQY